MYYRVLVASQRYHGKESLTYSCQQNLALGQLIQVPMQRQNVVGIVEQKVQKPSFATKAVSYVWDFSLPETSLELLVWMKAYYPAPLGMLTELFTPPALAKKVLVPDSEFPAVGTTALPPLTQEQTAVLKNVATYKTSSFLLHGQTGSGKTRVYLELVKQALADGRSALLLTPEIGLTEPLIKEFKQQFGNQAVVTHSGMTPAERRQVWLQALTSKRPLVIIGPRSALFMPLQNIGVVIVDEVHDSAYKQEHAPYYQASRVAAGLAQLHKAQLILGSATPPISDYFIFQQKNLPILEMKHLAIKSETKIDTVVIDQTKREAFSRSPYLANTLVEAIDQALTRNEQSLLFLNRRGSARLIMCENCGWQALCPHCDTSLTFHADSYQMRCHSCDFGSNPPSTCPDCGQGSLLYRSIGTKALETELQRLFPQATIARFDRDTEKAERIHLKYHDLQSGKVDIIVGTQGVVKGFDLPNLSVVGIVNADSGLQIPDFTAHERTFQLLSQVSGRIGRGHRAGKLFVQSYQPDSQILRQALTKDYQGFLTSELKQRELFKFPPYYFLAKVTCTRTSSKAAQAACQKVADSLFGRRGVLVEGPAPRFVEKVSNKYSWHLILKARHRQVLTDIAAYLPANAVYDLDPGDLL